MIYGFSLLFLLLGLVMVIPAARKILFMREINKNCAVTGGMVTSAKSVLGWLWTSNFGGSTRPIILYHTPRGIELNLEVVDSSMFTIRKYETGMAVDVIFDSTAPGRAYARPEWKDAISDLRLGVGALLLAVVLWVLGALFLAPF